MAESLSTEQLRQLARHGAAARIQELESEIAAIRGAFPDIARGSRRGRPPGSAPAAAAGTGNGRRRRTMSAAARKAVSERMKKYWAARRRAKR